MKKYIVALTPEERDHLTGTITTGKAAATALGHARILLEADRAGGGPGWTGDAIAGALELSTDTAGRVRQRFVELGLEAALPRKRQDRPSRERVPDGAAEARLIAAAGPDPPDERKAWALRMLAGELVGLGVVGAVSTEAVRRAVKKTPSSRTWGGSGACRRASRPGSSWPGWGACWTCTTGRSASGGRWRASARSPSNW